MHLFELAGLLACLFILNAGIYWGTRHDQPTTPVARALHTCLDDPDILDDTTHTAQESEMHFVHHHNGNLSICGCPNPQHHTTTVDLRPYD